MSVRPTPATQKRAVLQVILIGEQRQRKSRGQNPALPSLRMLEALAVLADGGPGRSGGLDGGARCRSSDSGGGSRSSDGGAGSRSSDGGDRRSCIVEGAGSPPLGLEGEENLEAEGAETPTQGMGAG